MSISPHSPQPTSVTSSFQSSATHGLTKPLLSPALWGRGHDSTPFLILLVLVTSAIFVLDLLTSAGVAVGFLYVLAVLITAWLPGTRLPVATAGICTGLTMIGTLFPAPVEPFDYWAMVLNRSFSIGTIWIVALAVLERKRSEEALTSIMRGSPIGMVLVDSDERIRMLNRQADSLFGYESMQLLGVGIEQLLPGYYRERHHDYQTLYIASSIPRTTGRERELVGKRQDGTEFPVEIALSPIATAAGKMTIVSIVDISERQTTLMLLKNRARQQSTVADIGQLALETSDLEELMNEVAVRTARTLDVEYSKILKLRSDGAGLTLQAGVGWRDGLVGTATVGAERNSHAGYTLACLEPVIVEDMQSESRFRGSPLLLDHGVVSGMSCVIGGPGGRPYGVVGCHTTKKRQFTKDDVHFLEAVANVLGQAVQRFHAEEERAKNLALLALAQQQESLRANQQSSIAELGKAALQTRDLQKVMDLAVHEVSKTLNVTCSKIVEILPDSGTFLLRAGIGWKAGLVGQETFGGGAGDSQAGYTVASGRPLIVEDLRSETRFHIAPFVRDHGIVSALNCPIIPADGIPYGVLEADSTERRSFSKDDLIYLEGLAQVVAFAIDRFRSEEAMRQYVLMLDASSEPIFMWDFDSGILAWNKGCERLYGFAKDEALGQKSHHLLRTQHLVSSEEFLNRLIEKGEWKGELRQTTKDGRELEVESRHQVIKLGGRRVVLESNRDITERKAAYQALQQSEARLAKEAAALLRLHELTNRMLVTTDLHVGLQEVVDASIDLLQADFGTIQLYDEETATLGIVAQRGFKQDFLEHFRRVKAGDRSACGMALERGKRVLIEDIETDTSYEPYRAIAKLAGYRAVQSTPLLSHRGQPLGMLSTHWRKPFCPTERDLQMLDLYGRQAAEMINRIHAENSLKSLNASLEERVRNRTQELLEKQEQLRAMTTELTLTEQRERRRLARELHDYLAQLLVVSRMKLSQVKRLVPSQRGSALFQDIDQILDQSLTYTRSLVAELSPQVLYQFGLPHALKWLGEHMGQHGLAVTITTEVDAVPISEEQAILLFQSVRELLFNVVKHAGTDRAAVSLTMASDGELCIRVADEGRGFDSAAAGGSSSVQFGLFSIRERMEGLKGRLDIHSSPGQGTCAMLVLPLESQRSSETPSDQDGSESDGLNLRKPCDGSRPHPDARVRVLLVDDHAMVRQGIRNVLEAHPSVEVIGEASNGGEALTVAKRLRPDVVVMDVNMDGMDGIEATKRLRTEFPAIRVIGLSVNADDITKTAMLNAGASVFLSKHAPTDQLSATILELMERQEA